MFLAYGIFRLWVKPFSKVGERVEKVQNLTSPYASSYIYCPTMLVETEIVVLRIISSDKFKLSG